MKTGFILLIFIVLSNLNIYSQERVAKDVKRTFYYSFNDASSIDQINQLKEDIEELKGVVKVKTEYKPEKQAGQVVVIVIEQTRTSEGQVFFSITDLKKLIIKNNLTPNYLQQEEVIIKK